jgi:uncharacterized RmlC-like cupin family protein
MVGLGEDGLSRLDTMMRQVLAATLGALTLGVLARGDLLAQPPVRAQEIITIRPAQASATRQGVPQFVGISGANSGARGLSMNRVVIPTGGRAEPHRHVGLESAVYLPQGRVKTLYGACLEKMVINQAGDFLFIPPGLPHMPVNLSAMEVAIAIVARNDANEQEQVERVAAPHVAGVMAEDHCPSTPSP